MNDKSQTASAPLDDMISIRDVEAISMTYWQEADLLADIDVREITSTVRTLLAEAKERRVMTLGTLAANSGAVIAAAAGCSSIHQYHPVGVYRNVHQLRNVLAAMTLSVATLDETDASALLAQVPSPPKPKTVVRRCLRDDEILLLRVTALYRADRDGAQVACQYALTEAGAYPSETTAVRPDDFDDERNPAAVRVIGVGKRANGRTLVLPGWCREMIAAELDRHLATHLGAAHSPLLYRGRGRAGGYAASASASGNLTNMLSRVGFNTKINHPFGITLWRVQKTLAATGDDAAAEVAGKRKEKIYTLVRKPERTVFDIDGPDSYLQPI